MFPMLLFQSIYVGVQWSGLGKLELIPLLSTALFPLVTVVEQSMPILLILRGVWFAPVLYAVVIVMTSSIVGDLIAFGDCTTPVLMVTTGNFLCQYVVLSEEPTQGFPHVRSQFRLLNKFWWVFLVRSSANWTCESLPFARYESFPVSFIDMFATFLIRSFLFPAFIVKFATLSIR